MTLGEFKAWAEVTAASKDHWLLDMVTFNNRGELLFYKGGADGKFVQINQDGTLWCGTYEGAVPHIGEATFHTVYTKTFMTQAEAVKRLKEVNSEFSAVNILTNTAEAAKAVIPAIAMQQATTAEAEAKPPSNGEDNDAVITELQRELKEAQCIITYMHAGRSTFTLRETATDEKTRFTYKIRKVQDVYDRTKFVWFVRVLTGPDIYSYLGMIVQEQAQYKFRFTHRSISRTAESSRAFVWFYEFINKYRTMPKGIEFWHSGRCAKCGKELTDPHSIETGFGPICVSKL